MNFRKKSIRYNRNHLDVSTKVARTQSFTVMGTKGTFIIVFTVAGLKVDGVACSTVGVSRL